MKKSKQKLRGAPRLHILQLTLLLLVFGVLGVQLLMGSQAADGFPYAPPKVTFTSGKNSNGSAYITATWQPGAKQLSGSQPAQTQWQVRWSRWGQSSQSFFTDQQSWTLQNVTCGAQYVVRVEGWSSSQRLSNERQATATAPCTSYGTSSPVTVTKLTPGKSGSQHTMTVTWQTSRTSGSTALYRMLPNNQAELFADFSIGFTTYTYNLSCNTSQTVYMVAYDPSGNPSPPSNKLTAKTSACPSGGSSTKPKPKPPSTSSNPAQPSSTNPTTTSSSSESDTTPPPVPKLTTSLQADRLVMLSWTEVSDASGIKHYQLERSSNRKKWSVLTKTSQLSYLDRATTFDEKYYYRIHASDNAGNNSRRYYASAQTRAFTPNVETAGETVVESEDKRVRISLPAGAFSEETSCSVMPVDELLLQTPPVGKSLLIGPYRLLCVAAQGAEITVLQQPAQVQVSLSEHTNFTDYEARQLEFGAAADRPTAIDQAGQHLSFSTTSTDPFAVYGRQVSSSFPWSTLLTGLVGLLGIGLLGMVGWRLKKALPAILTGRTKARPHQQIPCQHTSMITPNVQPQTPPGCSECLQAGTRWKSLRMCLTCGHVGCSDDSTYHHALDHFHQLGHPIIRAYADPTGDTTGWCYIDQTVV